jgi:hypothetical protein
MRTGFMTGMCAQETRYRIYVHCNTVTPPLITASVSWYTHKARWFYFSEIKRKKSVSFDCSGARGGDAGVEMLVRMHFLYWI